MNAQADSGEQCMQRLNLIYAWCRLLRTRATDAALMSHALESMERNAEVLLREVRAKAEGSS